MSRENASEESPRVGRARAWLLLVLGLALVAGYLFLERELPRGPQEFVSQPPLEPLPFAPLRGFSFEQLARTIYRTLLVAPALLLLSVACWRLLPAPLLRVPGSLSLRRLAIAASASSVALAAFFLFGVIRSRALLDDELTYAMQARLLADGKIAEDTVPAFAPEPFTIWTRLGFTGKYLFGEPLVQTPGVRMGVPALLHLPLHLLLLVVWFAQVRAAAGERLACWSTILLALSPLLVINTATGLSHTTVLAGVAVAGLGWTRLALHGATPGGAAGAAFLLGAGIGFVATVRPQVAVPVAAVLLPLAAWRMVRMRRFAALGVLTVVLAVFGFAILTYDLLLTGSPLRLPWYLYRPVEQYGFGAVLETTEYVHDVRRALENLGVTLVRLDAWWLGWPIGFLLLVLWWVAGRPLRLGAGWVWLAVGAAVVLFNFGYYSAGVSLTGPIYHFELLLPLSLIGAAAIEEGLERWPRMIVAMLVLHFAIGTTTFLIENGAALGRYLGFLHLQPGIAMATVDRPALLLYETAPQENVRLGWLNGGFPWRFRSDDDPVVTYPRTNPASVEALRRRYSERSCWYYRANPRTMRAELVRCEEAEQLLARPYDLEGPHLLLRSTAALRGLLEAPGEKPRRGADRGR